ncbi:MAG TPA: methyltransferase domain-containing protein [Rhodanobacter sp.]
MLRCHHDIYASAPMRRLLDDQMRSMAPDLQRCFGTHALLLDALPDETPPALPMLGHWVHLRVDGDDYGGELRAATGEPLPFVDDAFELILLRHALEVLPDSSAVLGEAVRMLAPGGLLVVTGVHPLSSWAPWFHWNTRNRRHALHAPLRLRHSLQQAGIEIERSQRVGRLWPGSAQKDTHATLGGGYVLIARKRRRAISPLRSKPVPIRVPANRGLSPGTRRSAAP